MVLLPKENRQHREGQSEKNLQANIQSFYRALVKNVFQLPPGMCQRCYEHLSHQILLLFALKGENGTSGDLIRGV